MSLEDFLKEIEKHDKAATPHYSGSRKDFYWWAFSREALPKARRALLVALDALKVDAEEKHFDDCEHSKRSLAALKEIANIVFKK